MQNLGKLTEWQKYQLWTAVCASLLLWSTWKLWTPQELFPQVPLFSWAIPLGPWVDRLGLGLMLLAIVASLVPQKKITAHWMAFSAGWLISVLVDQHRMQPWAYQFAVLGIIFSAMSPAEGIRWSRALSVSIYGYSALSKFDAQFLHTVGQDFFGTLSRFLGVELAFWSETQRTWGTAIFPLFELAVAIFLAVNKTRNLGCIGATVLHLSLLLILGPLGLNHSAGVLAWNLFFIGQIWILFYDAKPERQNEQQPQVAKGSQTNSAQIYIARGFASIVLFFPLVERFGYCDHWLAWALYAPHSSRAEMFIDEEDQVKLTSPWKNYVSPAVTTFYGTTWRQIDLSKWSLDTLKVPIYPQARFQYGAIKSFREDPTIEMRILYRGSADRRTGKRKEVLITPGETGRTPINLLNNLPRQPF
jgi:hypothetical protein